MRRAVGAQQKSGPESVSDRPTGYDVGTDDVTADAVSGDRVSSTAADNVRHDEELCAHARAADGGVGGGYSEHSRRLFAAHRLPGRSPRLQRHGKCTCRQALQTDSTASLVLPISSTMSAVV